MAKNYPQRGGAGRLPPGRRSGGRVVIALRSYYPAPYWQPYANQAVRRFGIAPCHVGAGLLLPTRPKTPPPLENFHPVGLPQERPEADSCCDYANLPSEYYDFVKRGVLKLLVGEVVDKKLEISVFSKSSIPPPYTPLLERLCIVVFIKIILLLYGVPKGGARFLAGGLPGERRPACAVAARRYAGSAPALRRDRAKRGGKGRGRGSAAPLPPTPRFQAFLRFFFSGQY